MTKKILTALFLASCSLAPDYQTPEPPKLISEVQKSRSEDTKEKFKQLTWQKFYQRKELTELIKEALKRNLEYELSKLNVKELQERFQIQKAQFFPALDINGNYRKQSLPLDYLNFPGAASDGSNITQEQASLTIGITAYELDFFGRIDSLKDAAKKTFISSQYAQEALKNLTVSKVASSYFNILGLKKQKRIIDDLVASYRQRTDVLRKRKKSGLISRLDIDRELIEIQRLEIQALEIQKNLETSLNNLSSLCNQEVKLSDLKDDLSDYLDIIEVKEIPSEALLKRPDVQAAEYKLIAANARIGAARAAFFPSISLTTSAGFRSSQLSGLIDESSESWLINPSINLPIFTWGKRTSELEASKILKKKEIIEYRQVLLDAFTEASNAIVQAQKSKVQLEKQQELTKSSENYYSLIKKRYEVGIEDFIAEVDAQQVFFNSLQNQVAYEISYLQNATVLFKSIAGN